MATVTPLESSPLTATAIQALKTLLHDERVQQVQRYLASWPDAQAAIVGGAVRDAILLPYFTEARIEDIDIVVAGYDAKVLAEAISDGKHTRCISLDEAWGIYRVIFLNDHDTHGKPLFLDIANALNDSLEDDLQRRDLSINALALTLHTPLPQLMDAAEGLKDLAQGNIHILHPSNLREDPLRVLRVFRFHAMLRGILPSVSISPKTLEAVKCCLPYLNHIAHERIAYEWMRLLSYPHCHSTLCVMGESGVLEALIPELRPLRCVPPNHHHHLPLWEHTLELVHQVEHLLPALDYQTLEQLGKSVGQGGTEVSILKLACLLHDVAKPHTWEVDATCNPTRHRFLTHDAKGEALTQKIARRLRLSSSIEKQVAHLVRWHLYPCTFHAESTKKSRLRFYRKMGEHTPLLCVLGMADTLSTRGAAFTENAVTESIHQQEQLLAGYWQTLELRQAPPLLNGNTIMNLLNLSPGVELGKVIAQFRDAQDAQLFLTVEDASTWIVNQFPPKPPTQL